MARKALLEYSGRKESKQYPQKALSAMSRKSQKISGGNSTSFVHDYHHAAEIMGDSEGFDSSCRVDMEMAASEGSCAPKRKCISLNVDNSDGFGVPMQIISVSKMCHSEREELKLRLREELKQIQMLQKKVTHSFRNGNAFSSSSDIHSSGQKRPPFDNIQRSSETLSGKGKKQVPPGKVNKCGVLGRPELVKQAVPSGTSHLLLMKQCESLLLRMMEHKHAWVFNSPVDVVKLNIPDYFTIIKEPMDLGTIKSNLASGAYSSPLEFLADVRLTFSNALTYNPPGTDVHQMAIILSRYFDMRWKPINKKLPAVDPPILPPKSDVLNDEEVAKSMHPSKKIKTSCVDDNVKPDIVKTVMTEEEKHKLSRDLESLITDLPSTIIDFFRENSCSASQIGEDEIEVDVDELSTEMLLKLRKLIDEHLQERQEACLRNADHCEMEVLNESGISNSSMQPCKAIDPVDEDVDIGGVDPPITSYPPVEIEKDTALRKSKCSSSSSSSSHSSSSSSDSDSGSSSSNESDGGKASLSFPRIKETLGSEEDLNQKRNDLVEPHDGNQSVSGLDQVEQACEPRPASVEADSHQDGGSTQSERQVSPDKLYRAALLRSRFADTILKAREKTLNQGEKGDPDKIQRQREEHERKKKEEKARLLAEAKAAEDARRQAEAEAAAEAKRKRELEREAARQALLQMEKTVEINENCQFLEDLEMLRVVPAEHIPSSVDETSPDHSEDGIGGFKLLGSNPLEQLGLFMKMDDEEDEEGEANNNVRDIKNDVEEGEID